MTTQFKNKKFKITMMVVLISTRCPFSVCLNIYYTFLKMFDVFQTIDYSLILVTVNITLFYGVTYIHKRLFK